MKKKTIHLPVCKTLLTTRVLTEERWEALKKLAGFEGMPVTQYICMLINHDIEKKSFLLEGDK